MNRFTPRLESLDGRAMPSAGGADAPSPHEIALHAGDDLSTEAICFEPAGGLRGGVVLDAGESDRTETAGKGYEAQKGSKGEEIPM